MPKRRPRLRPAPRDLDSLLIEAHPPARRGGRTARRMEGPPQEPRYVRNLTPRSEGQARLAEAIGAHDLTLALGPAGTGKTHIAVAKAVEALRAERVRRIVLTRPAVEAGERIGFLPGGVREKLDPYMRPLYDALQERMGARELSCLIEQGVIEIAPVAFLRGRTLAQAAIVVDEAQNATLGQLRMIVTRLGLGSFMVLTGDPDQSDLGEGAGGLAELAALLEGRAERVAVVRLAEADVVRHPVIRTLLPLLAQASPPPGSPRSAASPP